MFQLMLFTGSIIACIIGGLVVLIGIGAITGCAGGLIIMMAGGLVAFIGVWSAVSFFLPAPEIFSPKSRVITMIKHDGKWA